MKSGKNLYSLIKTISMIAGIIALIGVVVGLYFQILPERNIIIRYGEIGFFSLCIPVLVGEVWQSLKMIKCTTRHLEAFLGVISTGLLAMLYMAYRKGGVLTYELTTVILLTILIIIISVAGAEPINRALFNAYPRKQ